MKSVSLLFVVFLVAVALSGCGGGGGGGNGAPPPAGLELNVAGTIQPRTELPVSVMFNSQPAAGAVLNFQFGTFSRNKTANAGALDFLPEAELDADPQGIWSVSVTYSGQTVSRTFTVLPYVDDIFIPGGLLPGSFTVEVKSANFFGLATSGGISGAPVVVTAAGIQVFSGQTNGVGQIQLLNLPPGEYQVSAITTGPTPVRTFRVSGNASCTAALRLDSSIFDAFAGVSNHFNIELPVGVDVVSGSITITGPNGPQTLQIGSNETSIAWAPFIEGSYDADLAVSLNCGGGSLSTSLHFLVF